jgi:hypothetical protein
MKSVKFIQISPNEVKFDYANFKLVLEEMRHGVYGIGKCVNLYQLEGLNKVFIKHIGCTRSDNHGTENHNDLLLKGIVKFEDCQQPALEYVKLLIK